MQIVHRTSLMDRMPKYTFLFLSFYLFKKVELGHAFQKYKTNHSLKKSQQLQFS